MRKTLIKVVGLAVLLLVLALPAVAQNTKGDKPTDRESRFRKTDKKQKTVKKTKSKKNTSAYKPRKQAKGGERAGRATGRTRRITPRAGSERSRNIYPQKGRFVHNPSPTPREQSRISNRTASGGRINITTKQKKNNNNIYPQKGRFVNNPSKTPRDAPRSVSNKPALTRLKKLQGPDRQPEKKVRVQPRSSSRSYIARKTINIQARFPRPKRKTERAYTKDISGRRLRSKNYESKRPAIIQAQGGERFSHSAKQRAPGVQSERFGRFRNYSSARSTKPPGKKRRIIPRSISASGRKVYSQSGRYVNNPSKKPRSVERPVSNRSALSRLQGLQTKPRRPGQKTKVVPRSSSGSFIARRSTNTWAHFPRPKKKAEQSTTRDLAGRPLRTRNYRSPRQEVITPEFKPYQGRKRVGERAYSGRATGGFSSASNRGQRAWRGDIAKRSIRGIKTPKKDTPSRVSLGGYKSATRTGTVGIGRGRYRSATQPGEKRTGKDPLPVRQPGISAEVLRNASGKVKGRRGAKGGGSVSGRLWNNKGNSLQPKVPGAGANRAGNFQGNIKAKRQAKGGGSISGRLWNNQNRAILNKIPPRRAMEVAGYPGKMRQFDSKPGFSDQGEEYTGHLKARRPLKGGGSVSGRSWNNKRTPLAGKNPPQGAYAIGRFQGNVKTRRPEKGGGSVSGKLWNNKGSALSARAPGQGADGIEKFQGNIKANRPVKGGGSVSGRLWNNKGTALAARTPGQGADGIEKFQGNIKANRPVKGGGSVSGKLWNNKETPLYVKIPGEEGRRADGYSGNIRLSRFKKDYVKNPNASAVALRKERPGKSVYEEDRIQTKVRQYNYIKNKNSSEDATKVREPGKSFARAADFQGNVRMQKFKLFERNKELHPDARFIRTNKNNVSSEKDVLTNFKLWWARLFRKEETQPDHLKEKDRKPRYDKGEAGMWYD